MVDIIQMLLIDVFSKTGNPARKPLLWFFLIAVKINENRQGKASIDITLLANFEPMPTLNCIVWHLMLFCCEHCVDIDSAGIVAMIAMCSL